MTDRKDPEAPGYAGLDAHEQGRENIGKPDRGGPVSGVDSVRLSGGPCDGQRVPRPDGRSLLVELPWTEMVARYRQSRDRDVFRFREYDRVVLRIEAKP